MKISETSGGMFAIVQGIECRLTTRNIKNLVNGLELTSGPYLIDTFGIYRVRDGSIGSSGEAILIPQRVDKVKKRMTKLGYVDFDFDTQKYAIVKCYKF